ncbi:MAG: hypothetical protein LBE09_06455, partial [Christensenellaceae bacterium]|nr:hypothetical protein [Christensenellaceae bacterium]
YVKIGESFALGKHNICVENAYLATDLESPEVGKKAIKVDILYDGGSLTLTQLSLIGTDGLATYGPYTGLGDTLGLNKPVNGSPTVYFLVPENENNFTLRLSKGLKLKYVDFAISAYKKDIILPDTSYDDIYYKKGEYSKTVYVVDGKNLDYERLDLLLNIQGIVAKTKAEIYVDIKNSMYNLYVEQCYDPEIKIVRVNDVFKLLKMFQSHVKDKKFVTYNRDSDDIGINMAATVSAAESYLAVPENLREKVEKLGFIFHEDLSLIQGDRAQRQRVIFNRYKDKLSKDLLIHQPARALYSETKILGLRDYGIATGCFIFYTHHDDNSDLEFLRNEVLPWANRNIPVLGWTTDELTYVREISKFGDIVIPSDFSFNLTYLGALKYRRFNQPNEDEQITAMQGKHYIAIVVSDGDNLQLFQSDYTLGDALYAQRLRNRIDYKITWTIPPSAIELSAYSLQRVYATASENDYFISGPSGAGYMNNSLFPNEVLPAYAEKTMKALEACDIDVITYIDVKTYYKDDHLAVLEKHAYYSSYDTIKGGIWMMDPDKYQADRGKIYWSDDKPFVTVKHSLWDAVPDLDYLQKMAALFNNMSTDITTEGAYSLLNVHVWTIQQIAGLEYFVDQLAPHVEIVSVGELIDLLTVNVER